MPVNCYTCGQSGHVARDCGNAAYLDPAASSKPMWCGECDERTRLRDAPDGTDRMIRCKCHPESHKLIPHHRVCPRCHVTTVAWDTSDCGRHHVAGQPRAYVGPPPVPDDEWARMQRAPEPVPEFAGGLPLPPEYPDAT